MGASDQLLAARWNSGMPVSGGPDINNLEAVVKLITSIPLATAITVGLGLNEKCQFTSPIRSRGNNPPGTTGFRFRDTTTSLEWLVQNIAGELRLYYNTGSEDTPVWELHGQLPVQCICHVREEDAHTVGAAGYTVSWDGPAREDISTMWAGGAPTRVVIPFTGYYRITGMAYQAAQTITGWLFSGFTKNGAASVMAGSEMTKHVICSGATPGPSWLNNWYGYLLEDDYIEYAVAAQSNVTVADFQMIVERLS